MKATIEREKHMINKFLNFRKCHIGDLQAELTSNKSYNNKYRINEANVHFSGRIDNFIYQLLFFFENNICYRIELSLPECTDEYIKNRINSYLRQNIQCSRSNEKNNTIVFEC